MKTISIGRSQDNDVVLDNSQISRHHCELIQYDDGKVAICDNNSMNGTFVNGERISEKRFLQMSDSVRIGPLHSTGRRMCISHINTKDPPSIFPIITLMNRTGRNTLAIRIFGKKEISMLPRYNYAPIVPY
ncbi:MAG: FHA domain-containing protein [Bacteroidales bacterium]|nr:FHA domain-containing protein [Bacteroidales bacterium]